MKKLYLSKSDYKVAGLCGGIAAYFGIDSSFVRIIVVFLSLATAIIPSIITYIIAIILVPKEGTPIIHDIK